MYCIGTDIIEIARIEEAIDRWGKGFLHRVYTDLELGLCKNNPSSLAGRFAGKEAVVKIFGGQARGIRWKQIEILAESSGKPLVYLHDKAQSEATSLSLSNFAISLSHSREYAIAFVIAESK
jgi:holo-[acyl-carrier protein] synthase